MKQRTLVSLGKSGKRLRCDVFLDEMEQVVPWSALCEVIRPYYYGSPDQIRFVIPAKAGIQNNQEAGHGPSPA